MRSADQVTSAENSEREVLVFELEGQAFAIALQEVVEVLRAVALHMLPNAPAIVEGIINVRGSVVPVLDIRARFGLARKPLDIDDQLVLAVAGQRRVALRVDRAIGLMRIRPVPLEHATNLPRDVPHVAGVALLPEGLLLLHDLRAFLAEAESAQLSTALDQLAVRQGANGVTAITPASPAYVSIARQLSARTGIAVSRTPEDFARALGNTLRQAGLRDLEDLDQRLSAGMCWDELIAQVTVGETYFFRCPEHFAWIRESIVPALRQRCASGQPLRVWSAGCASGEEAYSLAILLHEVGLLERSFVLGSDVSATALAKARAAQYREWAFRAVDANFIARYFENAGAGLRCLNSQMREHVEFAKINLATDQYPNAAHGTRDMDLILCRNVLIYFDFDTIGRVARQLFDTLAPGGWLLTGPSDPMLSDYAPFEVVLTGNGICYRRPKLGVSQLVFPTQPSAVAASRQLAREPIASGERSELARDQAIRKDDVALSAPAERVATTELEQAILNVQSTWNTFDCVAAQRVCQQAIVKHPNAPELRYLLAVALLDAGNLSAALAAIRQALYLDRTLSIAHFTLGSILERMHDPEGARRAYLNAYNGARAQPPEELVRLSDGIIASGLAAAASRALAGLPGGSPP